MIHAHIQPRILPDLIDSPITQLLITISANKSIQAFGLWAKTARFDKNNNIESEWKRARRRHSKNQGDKGRVREREKDKHREKTRKDKKTKEE